MKKFFLKVYPLFVFIMMISCAPKAFALNEEIPMSGNEYFYASKNQVNSGEKVSFSWRINKTHDNYNLKDCFLSIRKFEEGQPFEQNTIFQGVVGYLGTYPTDKLIYKNGGINEAEANLRCSYEPGPLNPIVYEKTTVKTIKILPPLKNIDVTMPVQKEQSCPVYTIVNSIELPVGVAGQHYFLRADREISLGGLSKTNENGSITRNFFKINGRDVSVDGKVPTGHLTMVEGGIVTFSTLDENCKEAGELFFPLQISSQPFNPNTPITLVTLSGGSGGSSGGSSSGSGGGSDDFGAQGVAQVNNDTNTITAIVPADADITKLSFTIIPEYGKAVITPDLSVPRDYTNPVSFTIDSDGFVKTYTIIVEKQKSSLKKLTSFALPGVSSSTVKLYEDMNGNETIQWAHQKLVLAYVPYGTNVKALAPTIAVSPKATVSPRSGSAQDFTNPVFYTVTAEDGSTAVYEVNVKVSDRYSYFVPNNNPQAASGDWNQANEVCESLGGRLPTKDELVDALNNQFIRGGAHYEDGSMNYFSNLDEYWTSTVDNPYDILSRTYQPSAQVVSHINQAGRWVNVNNGNLYRCISAPSIKPLKITPVSKAITAVRTESGSNFANGSFLFKAVATNGDVVISRDVSNSIDVIKVGSPNTKASSTLTAISGADSVSAGFLVKKGTTATFNLKYVITPDSAGGPYNAVATKILLSDGTEVDLRGYYVISDQLYDFISDVVLLEPVVPVNGACSSVKNTCTAGTFVDVTDTSVSSNWSCNGTNGGTNASCSVPVVTAPVSGTYSLTVNAVSAGGRVTKSPNKTKYSAGEQVTITAKPNTGYSFSGWKGTFSGSKSNPLVIKMPPKNVSVVAAYTRSSAFVAPVSSADSNGTQNYAASLTAWDSFINLLRSMK